MGKLAVAITFVQNLGKNEMFGEIKEVIWISKIVLPKDREDYNFFVDEHSDLADR